MLRSMLAISVVALAAGFLGAQNAPSSASKAFAADPVHSSVIFRINHVGASYVYGRFNEIGGTFTLSDNAANPLSMDLQVKAESIDTHAAARDKHLRSPDFFNVKEFPTLSFTSTGSKKISTDKYEVTGNLTIHGVTKPLTTGLEVLGPIDHPKMGTRAGFETIFTVKRSDFGMDFMQGAGGLGDEVRVIVSVEGGAAKE